MQMGGGHSGLSEATKKEAEARAKMEKRLRDIEFRYQDEKVEHGLALDKDGNILEHNKGEEGQVGISSNLLDNEDAIFTHNHPDYEMDGYSWNGGVFSDADVEIISRHPNLLEFRAVDTKRGYALRRIVPPSQARGKDFYAAYAKAWDEQAEKAEVFSSKMMDSGKFNDTDGSYQTMCFTRFNKGMRKWLRNNAKKYGYEYREYNAR